VRKLNFDWVHVEPFRTFMSFSITKREKCHLSQPIKFEIVSPSLGNIMPTFEHGQTMDLQEVTSPNCRAKVHAILVVKV